MPPNGVLNAAANPAAAPVMIIFFFETLGHQAGSHWFIFQNTDPAIWMVGPSRPIIPPPKTMTRLDRILIKITRIPNSRFTLLIDRGVLNSMAAITWGMPLPLA